MRQRVSSRILLRAADEGLGAGRASSRCEGTRSGRADWRAAPHAKRARSCGETKANFSQEQFGSCFCRASAVSRGQSWVKVKREVRTSCRRGKRLEGYVCEKWGALLPKQTPKRHGARFERWNVPHPSSNAQLSFDASTPKQTASNTRTMGPDARRPAHTREPRIGFYSP